MTPSTAIPESADFSGPAHELSGEQSRQNLQAWTKNHAGSTVVLADEDMDRESIYGGHGRQLNALSCSG
jgi:hypothetical protein